MSLFDELKRRNVFRVGLAYLVGSWLLLQMIDVIGPLVGMSDEVARYILFLLAVGLIPVLILAWAFELTPEGVKLESEVDRSRSITPRTGRKLDRAIMVILALAVGFLLFDKLALRTGPESTEQASSAFSTNVVPDSARHESGTSPATLRSVAVLPFVAMSNGPDDDYFSDGLTEEIINALAQLPELLVTARTSAFHFKGQNLPIDEIAGQLGVDHVVEGSVRRAGEQLRITAQLVRAEDGFHLWSETYDRRTADTFAMQSDIAEKVATALNVVLDDDQRAQMRRAGIRNVEAYTAYQKGLEYHARAHMGGIDFPLLREGNRHFEDAITMAPELADAYLNRSDLYVHTLMIQAAGQLDGNISEADIRDAPAAMSHDWDLAVQYARNTGQRLVAEYDRALLSGRWLGLDALGRRALTAPGCEVAFWAYLAGPAFGRAQLVRDAYARRTICDPLLGRSWKHLAHSYLWFGQPDMTVQTIESLDDLLKQASMDSYLVVALTMTGRESLAKELVDTGLNTEQDRFRARSTLASLRGDIESAKSWLEDYLQSFGPDDLFSLISAAQRGERNESNRLADLIDRRPFGYVTLLQAIYGCTCGAPFDLSATPVFASMLSESGLPWPPLNPVGFPLKDW
jgi:TolB-like protein